MDTPSVASSGSAPIALTENDLDESGVLTPQMVVKGVDIPRKAVVCFFAEVIESIAGQGKARVLSVLRSEHGEHPVYEIERGGERLAVFHPGVGAPLAALFLEEAIALGCSEFVAVGGAGALTDQLGMGHVMVVDSAVRDEGTSFHYLPPGRVVDADPAGVTVLQNVLTEAGIAHVTGRSWTTDALYRETRSRVSRRVDEGCLTVDMEASAFCAVARYRGVRFAQLLYAGDSLAADWEHRGWTKAGTVREQLFWLAADACLQLS
ncbi:nucleoside phosphorylase [Rhodococcoides fascians]|uniref:nucleoside phosphorylase n=1 Tax=Rhodococcoides fascians TaxID=1828 RepID=UPI00039E75FE|nr:MULTISPECIES: nucleoside phosphorylase [Rhodococcus]